MGLAPWGALGGGNFKSRSPRVFHSIALTRKDSGNIMLSTPESLPYQPVLTPRLPGDEQRKSQEGRKMGEASPAAFKISKVLERIANNHKAEITSVALAYVMQKTPYVFPIVGGRKIEHLKGNIAGLSLDLSETDMKDIEGANSFDIGEYLKSPFSFYGSLASSGTFTLFRMP